MNSTDLFGPLVGPYTLEQAIVTHLRRWFWPTCLEAAEHKAGVAVGTVQPPDPAAIYGGDSTDEDYIAERIPGIVVVCMTPEGEPEHTNHEYDQQYQVQLISVVRNDDRDTVRRDASLYATACMAAMLQQFARNHPDLVQDVWMTGAPAIEFPSPDTRTVAFGRVDFNVFLSPIIDEAQGPVRPLAPEATVPIWPTITEIDVTVTAEPLDQPL